MIDTLTRFSGYKDERFSDLALRQHGAFLVNDKLPFEVTIVNQTDAVVRGPEKNFYLAVIDEFRYYAEHICRFYSENGDLIAQFAEKDIFTVPIDSLQPSQFYIDQQKKEVLQTAILSEDDIIVPVIAMGERFVVLDGHTRLSLAADLGLERVKVYLGTPFEAIFDFVNEAIDRKITTIADLEVVPHDCYEENWYSFCDQFWQNKQLSQSENDNKK